LLQELYMNRLNGSSVGVNNKWDRYLKCLPNKEDQFDATCDFWNEADLLELQMPYLSRKALETKHRIESIAQAHHVPTEELQFATWLARSRMFTRITTIPNEKNRNIMNSNDNICSMELNEANNNEIRVHRTVLIPYMDMINHSCEGNAAILIFEGHSDEESMYCLQATQDIENDNELLIMYGTGFETTVELFMKYGFFTEPPTMTEFHPNDYEFLDFNQLVPMWTTTYEQDIALLSAIPIENKTTSNRRKAISLRAYLKKLQYSKNENNTMGFI
jgi:SET domain